VKRNSAIELYRCLLMLGICLLHSVGVSSCSGTNIGVVLKRFLLPCVAGFVFVTGWFGISFKVSKVIRLCFVAILSSLITYCIDYVALDGAVFGGGYDWKTWSHQWWFLNAYLFLMGISPVLNLLVEGLFSGSKQSRNAAFVSCLGLIVCTFGVGFVADRFKIYFFSANIVMFFASPCSFAVFGGIYVAARLINRCNVIDRIGVSGAIVCLCVGSMGVGMGFMNHNSPFSLLFVFAIFALIKDIRIPDLLSRVIMLLAPSIFPVYLIHTHQKIGFALIRRFEDCLFEVLGVPSFVIIFLVACIVLIASVILDMPRRCMAFLLSRPLGFIIACIDNVQDSLLRNGQRLILNKNREF